MGFITDIFQDSLASEVAQVSYKDNRGALWFGYQSGDLARYSESGFEMILSSPLPP